MEHAGVLRYSDGVKTASIAAALLVLLSTCFAGVEVVEIGNVQVSKTLGGTVADPSDSPLPDVQVIEVASDWNTILRTTTTNAQGRWSLPPVVNRRIYRFRLVKVGGFNEVRFRVRLNKRKGKELRINLPLST
jgi:hypothetical protein